MDTALKYQNLIPRYKRSENLWVVTAYYNPCNYQSRRRNYEIFRETLIQAGIPLLTLECAFRNQPFNLKPSLDVIQIRSNSLIWQKERLINLGISYLPESCKAVAWLDCDLLFRNPNWAVETETLLEEVPIVQCFTTVNRLENRFDSQCRGDICRSFADITPKDPRVLNTGHFDDHGHTGYGWAARKDLLLKHGLYEHAIIGSGDHYIAHAIFGDFRGFCIKLSTCESPDLLDHFQDWASALYDDVQGQVAAVSGEVMHLWHGDLDNRQYLKRHRDVAKLGFNPYEDLIAAPGKPLEWNPATGKQDLWDYFDEYFASRLEDGKSLLQAA